MKKTALLLVLSIASTPLLASSTAFEPFWQINAGVASINMSNFNYQHVELDSSSDIFDTLVSASIAYQFTPTWSVALQVSPKLGSCSLFCNSQWINNNNQLLDVDYSVTFYNIEAQYRIPLSQRWSFMLNGGVTVGHERIETQSCSDYSSKGWFSRYHCRNDSTQEKISQRKAAAIAGLAFDFQFAKHWGLRFDAKASNYRSGYTMVGFSMSARF